MTLGFDIGPIPVAGPDEDLAFLLALICAGDREALGRLFDAAYPTVDRWLAAGVVDDSRRGRLVTAVFLEVWERAAEYAPQRISAIRWISSVVSAVLRDATRGPGMLRAD